MIVIDNKFNFFKHEQILLLNKSCLDKNILPKESIDLIITSPPYNVGIEYNSNKDTYSYEDYLDFSHNWISNCFFLGKRWCKILFKYSS